MTEEERIQAYRDMYASLKISTKEVEDAEKFRVAGERDLVRQHGKAYLIDNHNRLLREMQMIAFELPGAPK